MLVAVSISRGLAKNKETMHLYLQEKYIKVTKLEPFYYSSVSCF